MKTKPRNLVLRWLFTLLCPSYGVAGSFVVLLVWVYYSSQILFFGAELTQVYANQFGSRIVPDKNAEPLNEADDSRAVN